MSIATVSRVINGKGKVKEETRLKVEESIQKLNYHPDSTARSMILKETKTIGLMIPSLDEYWAILAEKVQEHLWDYGYTVMFCVSGIGANDKTLTYVKKLIQKNVDGIIYCGPSSEIDSLIPELRQNHFPIVVLDKDLDNVNTVNGNHIDGGKQGVEHLIHLGHEKIAYIGGPIEGPNSSPDRELGFRNGMLLNGLSINESLIVRGEFTFESGFEAMTQFLNKKLRFTAVCCGNDLIAFGAIEALKKNGIRVPEDVAVVGYDDIKMASLIRPKLTTVKQPLDKIAIGLVDLLLEELTENDSKQKKNLVFSMELIVRESCGANKLEIE